MIRYIYAADLHKHPTLAQSMFRDRADQFKTRLGWAVSIDAHGEERDAYDAMNPLYVIWEQPDGRHGGSMRLLPTTGRTMVNDHFSHLTDGVHIQSPAIWECTRFCLARGSSPARGRRPDACRWRSHAGLWRRTLHRRLRCPHGAYLSPHRRLPGDPRPAGRGARHDRGRPVGVYRPRAVSRRPQRRDQPRAVARWFDLSFGSADAREVVAA